MTTFSPSSFVAGCLLGLLGAGVWFTSHDALLLLAPATPTTATTTPSHTLDSGTVSIANQSAGVSVTVESVTVPPPGVWVAVREVSGTDLGNVLGAALVTSPRRQVEIPLLRSTLPGFTYAIELYRDNGDSVFDLSSDSVYIDFSTGAPVVAYFNTTE